MTRSTARPATGSAPSAKLLSVQYLRGVAALLVVFQHAYFQFDAYIPAMPWHSAPAAVELFFLVSGVIMMVTSVRAGVGEFAVRRLVRIVPLYWLFTLLLVALCLVMPQALHSTVVTPATLAKSLLFVPYDSLGHPGEIWPILVPGWTLNFEMFFYIVFGSLLVFPVRTRLGLATAAFATLVALGSLVEFRNPVLRTYTHPLLLDFVGGMAIGYLYLQRRRLPRWVAWLLLATGTGLIASDLLAPLVERGIRLPIYGAAAALVVLGCVQLDMAGHVGRWRLGLWLGDASYSIYLSHLVTLGALRVVWSRFGLVDLGAHAFAAAALVAAALVGSAAYAGVERPLLVAAHRLLARRPRPMALAPLGATGGTPV